MTTDDRQIVIFADARPGLAYLVRDRLADAGIPAFIENEGLQQGANELLPCVIGPRVVVAAPDALRAEKVVAEFRHESAESEASTGTLTSNSASTLARGPACPDCERPRMTVCPYCGTASAHFTPGDRPARAVQDEMPELVICGTCDEPFEPEYFRRCEWCGHDFGSGRESEPRAVLDYLNDRVILTTLAMGFVLVAILAYFVRLLR